MLKRCLKRISVEPQIHMRHRRALNDMVEHGGNFVLNLKSGQLMAGDETTGKYNQIDMIRGICDFHTHPRRCLNDRTCTVGVPSPADITNIVTGAVYGTQAHLLYSREGTYVVQVHPELLQLIRCDFDRLQRLHEYYKIISDELHALFLKRRFNYGQYIKRWVGMMNRNGLKVHFFKLNTVPRFTIPTRCIRANSMYYKPEITVPTDIGRDMKQRCMRVI